MRPNTFRDTARGVFLGTLVTTLMIVGVLLAGNARADGTLTTREEIFGDEIAGSLCDYLDNAGVNRESLYNLMRIIYQNTPADMDVTDSVDIINYAVYNYCPSHWDELVAFGEGART